MCLIFILYEIHCYFCPHIFWVYYFSLSQCGWCCKKFFFSACLLSHRLSRGPFTCLSGRHSQSVSDYILVSSHLKGVESSSRLRHGWFYTSKLEGVFALCEFHYCEFHYCGFSKLLLKFGWWDLMGYFFCNCVHKSKILPMRFLANANFSRSQK